MESGVVMPTRAFCELVAKSMGFPRESNHSSDTTAINSLIDFIENKLGAHTVNAISVALNCSLLSQENFPAALRTPLFFAAFSEYCKKCLTPIDALLKAPSGPARTSPVAPGPVAADTISPTTRPKFRRPAVDLATPQSEESDPYSAEKPRRSRRGTQVFCDVHRIIPKDMRWFPIERAVLIQQLATHVHRGRIYSWKNIFRTFEKLFPDRRTMEELQVKYMSMRDQQQIVSELQRCRQLIMPDHLREAEEGAKLIDVLPNEDNVLKIPAETESFENMDDLPSHFLPLGPNESESDEDRAARKQAQHPASVPATDEPPTKKARLTNEPEPQSQSQSRPLPKPVLSPEPEPARLSSVPASTSSEEESAESARSERVRKSPKVPTGRKVGRPRKHPVEGTSEAADTLAALSHSQPESKSPSAATSSAPSSATSTAPSSAPSTSLAMPTHVNYSFERSGSIFDAQNNTRLPAGTFSIALPVPPSPLPDPPDFRAAFPVGFSPNDIRSLYGWFNNSAVAVDKRGALSPVSTGSGDSNANVRNIPKISVRLDQFVDQVNQVLQSSTVSK